MKMYAYMNYLVVFVTGVIRDLLDRVTGKGRKNPEPGYVHLLGDFSDFFTRRFYARISDCFARKVTSNAGAYMDVEVTEQEDTLRGESVYTGETIRVMNLGSYNYLGFGDPDDAYTPAVVETLRQYGPGVCSTRSSYGTTQVHKDLEAAVARYLGAEDAICFGMGWATNATTIPAFVKKGDLILSDALNHNSIITGVRSSGASVRVIRHNDVEHLEELLRYHISYGQPLTRRPWGKILVIVEGIYSMDGDICRLAEIVALKKKYKFYIMLDEAHSIGCMGDTGRGVCEHTGVDPKDVDVLMGTFTKSFGAAGGYIAGSKELINWLRLKSYGNIYADAMPAPVAMQALKVLEVIDKEDGKKRLKDLHENSTWFRQALKDRGYHVEGDPGSPVVALILRPFYVFTVVTRECLRRRLGLVVVSYPACDILEGRVRICLNSVHSRAELQEAIDILDDVCSRLPSKED